MDFITGEFKLIDESVFDSMLNPHDIETVSRLNYCQDCPDTPMILAGNEYQCPRCGQVQHEIEVAQDHDDTVSGSIRITTGSSRGRYYTNNGDYTKTQKKFILDQLIQNQSAFTGNAFPRDILHEVATKYNSIQKMITEDDIDSEGNVRGQKKFVRRGNIKDEVLAGLIYFECIRKKLVRKKKDIAVFMKLPTYGFSRGEDILRNLQAEGKIDIPVDEEPIEGFVDRYLEALNLENPIYSKFIVDLVNESERLKIGMNSQLSSKVVGSVWIIITKCGLKITAPMLEKAADNTKKNTFVKFTKVVFDNMGTLGHIFTRHGIPK